MSNSAQVTYLVGSYREPGQLARLVSCLREESPSCRVVVLRDAGAPILQPRDCGGAEVFTTPDPVTWGDGTHLRGLLAALQFLDLGEDEWCATLSEQSYPVRPVADFEAHLRRSGADAVLEQSIVSHPFGRQLLARYSARSVAIPFTGAPFARRVTLAVQRRLHVGLQVGRAGLPIRIDLPRARTPFGSELQPRMGSDWFALRGTAAKVVVGPENARLRRYFGSTFSASEGYFHTVVLNHPGLVNLAEPTHFTRWSGGAHPDVLDLDDLGEVVDSGAWFARKLADGPVLDALDAHRGSSTR